jgi:hypothetical protein
LIFLFNCDDDDDDDDDIKRGVGCVVDLSVEKKKQVNILIKKRMFLYFIFLLSNIIN